MTSYTVTGYGAYANADPHPDPGEPIKCGSMQIRIPHPLVRGGGHTRLRLKGWGSPNSNEGTYTVVLYIYKYFVILCM
jgi:hypothetical protein